MTPRLHAGWRPALLRCHRDARGWTLEQVAEAIRSLSYDDSAPPAATFQTVGLHERGKIYPGPRYRRAYCILYRTTEPKLGFRLPLPGETDPLHAQDDGRVEDEDMNRRDLLRSVAGSPTLILPQRAPAATERDCVEWIAWTMWERGTRQLHESELPAEIAHTLAISARPARSLGIPESLATSGILIRDDAGSYSFSHPSLIDLFIAQAVFSDITQGRLTRLAAAQTRHETDKIVSDFVSANEDAARTLGEWMHRAVQPVTRVNSAGILAKVGSPELADNVIATLRRDAEARELYVAAVIMRLLTLDWSEALKLTRELNDCRPEHSDHQYVKIAGHFAKEIRNPRDVGARWSSVLVLSRLGGVGVATARPALAEALAEESSRETLRAIGQTLAGSDPLAT